MATRDPNTHYEHPDPTPVAIPSGFKRPETLAETVARLVRSDRFRREAEEAGFETFEEADDFDVEDDPPDPATPFEPFFDPALGREVTPADVIRNRDAYARETEKREIAAKAAKKPVQENEPVPATTPAAPPAAASQEPGKAGS